MKYKAIVLVALIAFAVSLAVVVGQRLSAEAMAVIVGVVAGVAASIPTSLIVVWIALRARPGETRIVEERRRGAGEPRVVVVAPPVSQPAPGVGSVSYYTPADPGLSLAAP